MSTSIRDGYQLLDKLTYMSERVGMVCNLSSALARYRMKQQLPQMVPLVFLGKPSPSFALTDREILSH